MIAEARAAYLIKDSHFLLLSALVDDDQPLTDFTNRINWLIDQIEVLNRLFVAAR